MENILQKELKIYRFKNRDPFNVRNERYDYQLWKNGRMVTNSLSDGEFPYGKVSVINNLVKMELSRKPQIDSREMEDTNTFLITVIISN